MKIIELFFSSHDIRATFLATPFFDGPSSTKLLYRTSSIIPSLLDLLRRIFSDRPSLTNLLRRTFSDGPSLVDLLRRTFSNGPSSSDILRRLSTSLLASPLSIPSTRRVVDSGDTSSDCVLLWSHQLAM